MAERSERSGWARLTGTVAYRERIALQPGSEITVVLQDVSRDGARLLTLLPPPRLSPARGRYRFHMS